MRLLLVVFYPVERLLRPITASRFHRYLSRAFDTYCFPILMQLLLLLRITEEIPLEPNDARVRNRTHVILTAARAQGIHIFGLPLPNASEITFFSLYHGGQRIFFEQLPIRYSGVQFDNKAKFKDALSRANLPTAESALCLSKKSAQEAAARIGFPVVVKPVSGSLSRCVTTNIKTEMELKQAIDLARTESVEFLVEKYVPGKEYRATLVNGNLVAICQREAPNVVGDGIHSIAELIAEKNDDPRRGCDQQLNTTLHKISSGKRCRDLLKTQGYTLNTIPRKLQKIYLGKKVTLHQGADIHDVTNIVHPDTVSMLERAATVCKSSLAGIDLITRDITVSYKEQTCAILEANSLPYIDMHHFPVTGNPRDVAGAVLTAYVK